MKYELDPATREAYLNFKKDRYDSYLMCVGVIMCASFAAALSMGAYELFALAGWSIALGVIAVGFITIGYCQTDYLFRLYPKEENGPLVDES